MPTIVESSQDPERKGGSEAAPVTRPSLDRSTDPTDLMPPPSSVEVPVSIERRSTQPDPEEGSPRRLAREGRPGETTLLSAPAPADPREIEVDDRLDEHDRRLADIDERLEMLTNAYTRLEKSAAQRARHSWLGWVIFLLVLALLWQLGQWLR